jgi:hypothetical protein
MRINKVRRGAGSYCKKRLRLPARVRLARMNLKRSAGGLSRAYRNLGGALTWLGDRIESNTPTTGRRVVNRLRALNPLSLTSFALQKFKQDPWFLSIYSTWSFGFSNSTFPLALALGATLPVAGAIRIASGVPVDLAVLYWRQHHLMKKKDPNVTWGDVRKHLGKEYGEFVVKRRQENRDFMAGRKAVHPPPVANH